MDPRGDNFFELCYRAFGYICEGKLHYAYGKTISYQGEVKEPSNLYFERTLGIQERQGLTLLQFTDNHSTIT